MSQRENISSEEVEKFNDLAREWWNPHGSFAPLHKLNPLRFEYIRENSSLEGKSAIDVGFHRMGKDGEWFKDLWW